MLKYSCLKGANLKKFFSDFKKFISRGNILDMAVGVIIGNAFSAIVTAFTDKIIMPLINFLLSMSGGEEGLASAFTFFKTAYDETGAIDLTNSIYIDWGAFITAILNFLIIALTLFIILKVAMKSSEFFSKTNAEILIYKLTKEEKKELKQRGISTHNKKAIKAYKEEKAKLEEEKKKLAEEEAKAKAEAERLANPTQEDLLKQIVELLKEKKNNETSSEN